ncbi:DUF418 domain-containing protein [Micromonospora sp. NPDC049523]|uniref:DUF418 domain-containing protein n=1 Tax=Micromonospora sp. NPDC049523 TaxID=3155921 RepID=UPI00343DDA41
MSPISGPVRVDPPVDITGKAGDGARIGDLDALRGFALFGILVVNIAFFASGYPFHLIPDPAYGSWVDQGTRWLVEFLFTMKFYLLFSFLFGYSFTLQIDSAVRRGVTFAPRFRRRLAGLFVLGVLHAVFLFHGDILTTYALLGLVLLAARGMRPKTASTLAAALLGLVALLIALVAVRGGGLVPDDAVAVDAGARSTEALGGGLGSVLVEHLRAMPAMISALLVQGPLALCAFLVGLAAGKVRLLADVTRHQVLLRRVQQVGYPIGLAGALVFAIGGGTANLTGLVLSILTAPLLMAAYVATALRGFHTGWGHRLAGILAPAGRMALSNYLGQSVAAVLIFTGIGLGLVGRVAPLPTLLIAVGIFGGQLLFSAWWLARFRYGPVEWLLRSWTEARRVGFRR